MTTASARRVARPRSTSEYLDFAARIVAAAGDRVAEADPAELRQLIAIRNVLDEAILEAVRGLRDSGATWQDIGDATGTTRQAAIMKWAGKL